MEAAIRIQLFSIKPDIRELESLLWKLYHLFFIFKSVTYVNRQTICYLKMN